MERKSQGAKVPMNESSRERKFQGAKDPHLELSLPGANGLGSEKSSYPSNDHTLLLVVSNGRVIIRPWGQICNAITRYYTSPRNHNLDYSPDDSPDEASPEWLSLQGLRTVNVLW